jgi:hypothetical protein
MHGLTSETPPLRGSCYTEEDWNNDSTIENGQFYPLSKVRTSACQWTGHVGHTAHQVSACHSDLQCLYCYWLEVLKTHDGEQQ